MAVSYTQWIEYMFWKSGKSGIPLSGTFELTSRCNLDCKMCYIHKRANDAAAIKQELTTEQWISMAKEAKEQGMLLLLLTGGEPLLRKDFKEIYTACRKMGIIISLNTNGTMITEEMVEFFKKDPPIRVNITLYGASAETYKELCGDPTAYERAYKAVEMLTEAGIRVKINYSATPQNIQDIEKVYKFANDQELLMQLATYMFPPIRACEHGTCSAERLSAKEAAEVLWNYDCMRFPEEILKKRVSDIFAGKSVDDPDKECQELPTERIRCRAGHTTFWVTYDGQMRPCGMMQVPTVDVMGAGFEKAWEQIRQEREKIMIPAKCTACQWKNACEFCPAMSYAENGVYEQSPDYICEKTKAYLEIGYDWLKTLEKN